MIGSDGLLCLFFCYLIGFGGYEGYEFNATVNQKITRISGKGDTRGSEDFRYDLLNGGCAFYLSTKLIRPKKTNEIQYKGSRIEYRDPIAYLWVARGRLRQIHDLTSFVTVTQTASYGFST